MGVDGWLMLHSEEMADQLKRCADGRESIEDFEEWFALNSWNVHQQQDKDLIDAVFRVEYLFSSLNDGRLKAPEVLHEFADLATAMADVQALRKGPTAPHGRPDRKVLPFEAEHHPQFPRQSDPASPYSIAKSQQFIPEEESNWLPGVLAFGSLDAGISLSFGE
jgi:hypothetical protein